MSTASPSRYSSSELTFNTAPNWLTLLRIAFVPLIIFLVSLKSASGDLAAAICFGVAAITDYFDGYLARVQKAETVYGKLMDPLADKFLVVSALILLQDLGRVHPYVVLVLICREMAVTGLRALASAEGVIIAASASAKWKTGTQMVAIPFLLAPPHLAEGMLARLGWVLLYVSLSISLWSAKDYLVDFFSAIRKKKKKSRAPH